MSLQRIPKMGIILDINGEEQEYEFQPTFADNVAAEMTARRESLPAADKAPTVYTATLALVCLKRMGVVPNEVKVSDFVERIVAIGILEDESEEAL